MHCPHFLTQLGHYVLDHECFPGARGKDIFPWLEDELGRGVAGVPLLQGAGQLAADGGVKRLQARLHEGQPRVDPGVDGDSVRQWVPVFYLETDGEKQSMQPVRQSHDACVVNGVEAACPPGPGPQSFMLHFPKQRH